jgi:RNA polymerase sigma-70 factor, ECF subfamily
LRPTGAGGIASSEAAKALGRSIPCALVCGWRVDEAISDSARNERGPEKGAVMSTQAVIREGALAERGKSALADENLLVAKAKCGHSSAFGELYMRHRGKIYRSVFRILRNREDAEDAMQRSFQRAFTNLRRFRGDSAFATWITRIAINEALMLLRQRPANTSFAETDSDEIATSATVLPDERPTPEQALVENELCTTMTDAISCLRENLRVVVLLREFQGLTSSEIARRLGLTVSAVKARTFHARRYLRRYLKHKYKIGCVSALIATRN